MLRLAILGRPDLRRCLKRCDHCDIFFLTDPRNVARDDLRCPFGCRQEYRKRGSSRRSTAYYRTDVGKTKKKALNDRRRKATSGSQPASETVVPEVPGDCVTGDRFDPDIVSHLQAVISLIEGRRITREEILWLLNRVMRQPRMASVRKVPYGVLRWNRKPP